MSAADWLQPDDLGLEPLGPYRGGTSMSTTMRAVFDVLYEADRPLTREEIAERTFERATGAAIGHARRWTARRRRPRSSAVQSARRLSALHEEEAFEISWSLWLGSLLKEAVRRGSLIRIADQFSPNPDKAPVATRPDGTQFAYTREAWLAESAEGRAIDEVQTMRMEADRLLGPLTQDELLIAVDQALRDFSGFPRRRRPVDPRTVRTRIKFLLERPTTDTARAWLLHELVRRIYEN